MIPKFSIRQLLLAMIAIGMVSACMAGASRGNRVAFALSVAIFSTAIPFVAYAIVHWFAFGLALLKVPKTVTDSSDALATSAGDGLSGGGLVESSPSKINPKSNSNSNSNSNNSQTE